MADKAFSLEIRTPERLIFDDEVTSVRGPGNQGNFQVLAGHIPFLTVLEPGIIIVRSENTDRPMATSGGLFEVLPGGTTALLDTAEWLDEIDPKRAESARERAVNRLASRDKGVAITRAEAALRRALVRIKVASR